ncbi:NAD binding domain of 6-phosphogluconate dehydrogenase-domain-containing protein [Suillus paluster]|uniref:NAD binding domain of 6-phosphogluconate dehydrogenase-domain-containing protein n=1 Tax=Suillus paluster TaxID=48578 RepID=UPI001B86B4A5|nr:NAD binding domain of 6-phosphogluconate dehydrogenase-domain-containing protein [Suillus paluster]KAG1749083.1 NAD binding domain of 6-phosphogluconate dehydrogenase-domain-containing protein [Suillus paluster]
MKHTARVLQSFERQVVRAKSTAFIGLGRMGSEMAFNLFSKTFAESPDAHFVVCDAFPTSAIAFRQNFVTQFPGAHIDIVQTPKDAVHASQTVLTMLPSSPQVKTVYSEANGVIPGLQSLSGAESAQTFFIDSTTLDVGVARSVAADVMRTGAQMVDAPVSGGVTGAKAGTLSFLVGGTEGGFELSQPILTYMGNRIIHCGPSGAGLGAKICNNLVLGVQQIVVAEAMLLGQKLGLNPRILAGVINSSTGGCWASSVNNPVPYSLPEKSPPCERNYEGGFATALMLKDMLLATDIAASTDSPLPLGKSAQNFYAETLQHRPDLAQKDFSSVYERLEQMRRKD